MAMQQPQQPPPPQQQQAPQPQREPPDHRTVYGWIHQAEGEWSNLQERMREHQRAYEGRDDELVVRYVDEDGETSFDAALTDLSLEIDKAVSIIAGAALRVDVEPLTSGQSIQAQRLEEWMRLAWMIFEKEHKKGVRASMRWDEAFWAILRGCIVRQVILNPDKPFGYEHRFVDPYHVFPIMGENQLFAVFYKNRVSRAQAIQRLSQRDQYPFHHRRPGRIRATWRPPGMTDGTWSGYKASTCRIRSWATTPGFIPLPDRPPTWQSPARITIPTSGGRAGSVLPCSSTLSRHRSSAPTSSAR